MFIRIWTSERLGIDMNFYKISNTCPTLTWIDVLLHLQSYFSVGVLNETILKRSAGSERRQEYHILPTVSDCDSDVQV